MLRALDDGQRMLQRAGPQHEREVLRFLQVPVAERDLAAAADGALDDRCGDDAVVEHDRHVVLQMASGLGAEAAAALGGQREGDDRAFLRALLRTGIGDVLAGDDRPRVEHVELAIRLAAHHHRVTAPPQHLARRQRFLDGRLVDERAERGHVGLGDEELPRHLPLLHGPGERALIGRPGGRGRRIGAGAVAGGRRRAGRSGRVGARLEDVEAPIGRRRRPGVGADRGRGEQVALADDLVEARDGLLQGAGLVGDLELEERGLLNDRRRPRGVLDPRQLHDDPILPDLLHHRLGHAELVDAVAGRPGSPGRWRRPGRPPSRRTRRSRAPGACHPGGPAHASAERAAPCRRRTRRCD